MQSTCLSVQKDKTLALKMEADHVGIFPRKFCPKLYVKKIKIDKDP